MAACLTGATERIHPTLERIDRIYVTLDWEDQYPNNYLHSLYSGCSDHAPLLLQTDVPFQSKKRFHFDSIWTN